MVHSLAGPMTFDPVRGTLDALVGSGQLGLIRDRSLQESLTTFLNLVEDAVEDASYMAQSAVAVWNAEVKHGGPWADPRPGDVRPRGFLERADAAILARVRADTELMGLAKLHRKDAENYTEEVARLAQLIDSILSRLEGTKR